jgi:hypothetical protein
MKANKKCETCSSAAIITERFCGKCKKAVLKKLQELKYLQPDPYGFGVPQYGRGYDQMENTRETKYGID